MKSMKRMLLAVLAIFLFQTIQAQDKTPWKELKDFHGVMSKTFHPAEDGNLQPLREHSGELLASAKTWQAAPVAPGYKPEETKKVLKELVSKCEEVDKAVAAKADDKELTTLITEAHEVFHQIVEKCRKGEEEK